MYVHVHQVTTVFVSAKISSVYFKSWSPGGALQHNLFKTLCFLCIISLYLGTNFMPRDKIYMYIFAKYQSLPSPSKRENILQNLVTRGRFKEWLCNKNPISICIIWMYLGNNFTSSNKISMYMHVRQVTNF